MESKLSSIYYDPSQPGSLGGARALKQRVPVDPTEWLKGQDAYTLHKTPRKRFERRRTIVAGMNEQWQADLIDVSSLKRCNKGMTYVLTIIDVFSKMAWARPLKNKSSAQVLAALTGIFKETRPPRVIQTDKGKEFTNKRVQAYLKKKGVGFFTTENDDIKAAVVERFNRTLKEKLWRYFTAYGTYTYLDVLPKILKAYNTSYHRSIGTSPDKVSPENQETVWQRLYGGVNNKNNHREIPLGATVRISKTRTPFKKGYLPSWTTETFTVAERLSTTPRTYRIQDEAGELLRGSFYTQELQVVTPPSPDKLYRIEKIIKRSGKRTLVKWEGYPKSFNSWIEHKDIQRDGRGRGPASKGVVRPHPIADSRRRRR